MALLWFIFVGKRWAFSYRGRFFFLGGGGGFECCVMKPAEHCRNCCPWSACGQDHLRDYLSGNPPYAHVCVIQVAVYGGVHTAKHSGDTSSLKGTRTLQRVGRTQHTERKYSKIFFALIRHGRNAVRQFRHGFFRGNTFPSGLLICLTQQWRYRIGWRDKEGKMIQPSLLRLISRFDSRWAINSNGRRTVNCVGATIWRISEILITATNTGGKILAKKLGN